MKEPPEYLNTAAKEAIHASKNAAQAVEMAREAQLATIVSQTAKETRAALLEGLQQIFGEGDEKDPEHMKIIYGKIPVLCIRVDAIDKNIAKINDNMTWIVRIVIGAVILGVLKVIMLG